MLRLIFIIVVIYCAYQLATNWSGSGGNKIEQKAEEAAHSVRDSEAGRQVEKTVETLEHYVP